MKKQKEWALIIGQPPGWATQIRYQRAKGRGRVLVPWKAAPSFPWNSQVSLCFRIQENHWSPLQHMGEVSLPGTGPTVPVSLIFPLVLQTAISPTTLILLGSQVTMEIPFISPSLIHDLPQLTFLSPRLACALRYNHILDMSVGRLNYHYFCDRTT